MRFALLTRAVAALTVVWLVVEAEKAQAQTPPIQIDHNTAVAGMASDTFTWIDSLGHPRVAVLAHNDVAGPGGAAGGTLREFRYQLPDLSTRIATVTTYGNGGNAGFGYVVSHANHSVGCIGVDDSPLGGFILGNWYRIFEGRHHAIFRFTQNYPRYCSAMAPVEVRTIPVTIDWIFTTGHDNPVWAITYDVDLAGPDAPSGTFYDDSRAPYGELNIDGDGSTDIDGVAWGDRYKFFTTTAPVTLSSDWDWTQTNTVPYVKLWLAAPLVNPGAKKDATMGLVQTQTIDQQDGGGARNTDVGAHDVRLFWGKTSAQGNAGGAYKMPWQDEWPYQANADSIGVGVSNNNARLTWRTQYGFIGPLSYNVNDQLIGQAQRTAPGYGKKSYSTYIVIGTHSSAPVEAQLAQVENVQTLTLTAAIGSVVTSGPAGITRADNVTYQPAGYNHVYGALAFNASGNRLDANVAVGTGPLTKPLLIVGNYTAVGYPQVVRLGGAMLTADVDYFPSLRASAQELWITLNRNLNGPSNRIEIFASATVPDPPVIGTGTPGNGGATISFTPPASDGGSSITSYRVTCNPGAFMNSDAGSPITVSGLTNGTAYDCYVVAMNTVGSSGASGTVTVTPGGSTTPGGDFDGDGKADVLWRNFTTGDVFMHRMSGASIISGTAFYREANTQWKIITTADFNGDGKADILWRNFTTGQVYIQLMNGVAITDGAVVYVEPNMQWEILAAADFDGDGKADILWRNSSSGLVYVLLMNGLAVKGGGVVYGEPNPSWQIVAAADFDGDRKADILWRNSSTGQVYVLLMNGLAVANGGFVYTEPNQAWQIVASGDFNADGMADILWRNTSSGAVYILLMNGLSTAGGALIYTEPSQSWKINGVADFNGDGKADILWRNTVSGGEFIQLINGLSITSGTFVYNEPNTQWKIVSPTTVAAAVTGNGTN